MQSNKTFSEKIFKYDDPERFLKGPYWVCSYLVFKMSPGLSFESPFISFQHVGNTNNPKDVKQ